MKWMLITVALNMYGWASMDMLNWSREFERTAPSDLPSRHVRPWLSNGLIIHFQFFGAIYLASAVGAIGSETEQLGDLVAELSTLYTFWATIPVELKVYTFWGLMNSATP